MGMTATSVMLPGPFKQTLVLPSPEGFTWNLASMGLAVIEKNKFEIIEFEWLGPRSVNELWYSQSFKYSFRWLYLPTFIS